MKNVVDFIKDHSDWTLADQVTLRVKQRLLVVLQYPPSCITVQKRLKVPTFIYRHLQGNQNSTGLQLVVVHWPALAVGSAAQLAAAQYPNEQNLDPQSAARQTHLCPSQLHYGLHPAIIIIIIIIIII